MKIGALSLYLLTLQQKFISCYFASYLKYPPIPLHPLFPNSTHCVCHAADHCLHRFNTRRQSIPATQQISGELCSVQEGESEAQARQCPQCTDGVLGIKLSRGGGFIGCSRYPECGYARSLTMGEVSDDEAALAGQPLKLLLILGRSIVVGEVWGPQEFSP